MAYQEFFSTATGWTAFGFQGRFRSINEELVILRAFTGLGKTETVLVSWLHRRPHGTGIDAETAGLVLAWAGAY